MCVPHRVRHAQGAQANAQRQGVDEDTQRAVGSLAAVQSAKQHGAEHHVVVAGSPG